MRGPQFATILTDAPAADHPLDPDERFVSFEETCHRLGGITRREVYNRIAAGDLLDAHMGKRHFIVESSLRAYIHRLINKTPAAGGAA